jgi:hypothetical protein
MMVLGRTLAYFTAITHSLALMEREHFPAQER